MRPAESSPSARTKFTSVRLCGSLTFSASNELHKSARSAALADVRSSKFMPFRRSRAAAAHRRTCLLSCSSSVATLLTAGNFEMKYTSEVKSGPHWAGLLTAEMIAPKRGKKKSKRRG